MICSYPYSFSEYSWSYESNYESQQVLYLWRRGFTWGFHLYLDSAVRFLVVDREPFLNQEEITAARLQVLHQDVLEQPCRRQTWQRHTDRFILTDLPRSTLLMLFMADLISTFVVVPHADLQHAAQAGVGGDVEDVQAVSSERADAVQVSVSTAALTTVKTDAHVSRGSWSGNKTISVKTTASHSVREYNYEKYSSL